MRELKVVGVHANGRHVLCAADGPDAETVMVRLDERLRAAARGDLARAAQTPFDIEVSHVLNPREIQARIRAGASVEQVADAHGMEYARVERFAHPVLLERSRAAELATAAHPVLPDGPAVLSLLEVVTASLVARGLDPTETAWDAWKNEDGRWTVQLMWRAGRSENLAHYRFAPGAHGGTVAPVDDPARELIDPHFARPLRPVAPVAQLPFHDTGDTGDTGEAAPDAAPRPVTGDARAADVVAAAPQDTADAPAADEPQRDERTSRRRRARPAVPGWEDVLLGVRSGSQP